MTDWVRVNVPEAKVRADDKDTEGPIFGEVMETASQPLRKRWTGNVASLHSSVSEVFEVAVRYSRRGGDRLRQWLKATVVLLRTKVGVYIAGICISLGLLAMSWFLACFLVKSAVQDHGVQEGLSQTQPTSASVYIPWQASQREVDLVQKVRGLGMIDQVEEILAGKEANMQAKATSALDEWISLMTSVQRNPFRSMHDCQNCSSCREGVGKVDSLGFVKTAWTKMWRGLRKAQQTLIKAYNETSLRQHFPTSSSEQSAKKCGCSFDESCSPL